jgi:hypothetical protein
MKNFVLDFKRNVKFWNSIDLNIQRMVFPHSGFWKAQVSSQLDLLLG